MFMTVLSHTKYNKMYSEEYGMHINTILEILQLGVNHIME